MTRPPPGGLRLGRPALREPLPDPDTDLRDVYPARPQVDQAEVIRLDELRRPTRERGER